ncbi:MAG: fibrobacter succinogenes major paralogous domain-containing protein [Flavobacteriaceae bacterium]|jgi:uncharacterized protein (TIGR02145 family)|nr:fibrobacter succinogenes major paralogous domain-containing protein [Flavobacteriaceae bacterium]
MKKNNYLLIPAVAISFCLSSCRSTDTDKVLDSGPAAVKVNLVSTEFEDGDSSSLQAKVSLGGDILNASEKQAVLITPGMVVVSELSSLPKELKNSAQVSKGLNVQAAIPGASMVSGRMFRIIAYRSSDGSYQTHQDYIIGQPGVAMALDGGVSYDMVVYSYNSATLPVISSGEKSNIGSAIVSYDDTNRDFLYKKISGFTPTGGVNNTLNITLKHLFTEITAKLVSNAGNITGVSNAVISPHNTGGTIALLGGAITRSNSNSTAITFLSGSAALTQTSNATMVNGNGTSSFSATVSLAGGIPVRNLNYTNSFSVTPGTQKLLTVNIQRCGAIVNGAFKEFMCHNLGATNTADPFTAAAAIHGNKYQWGSWGDTVKEGIEWYSQSHDQSNSGAISGWRQSAIGSDAWGTDTTKGTYDPCPSGYRVPTSAQWQSVINSNSVSRVGTWTSSSTNYGSGIQFGNYLFLPAAGYRYALSGTLNERGSNGYYWSTSVSGSYVMSISFSNSSVSVGNANGTSGDSVRCIAE